MIRLAELRKEKNLSQKEIARVLQITQQAYSNYENGRREPDYNMLKKIADLYKVSLDWLLNNEIQEEKKSRPVNTERDTIINKLIQRLEAIDDLNILKDVSDYSDYLTYRQNQSKE